MWALGMHRVSSIVQGYIFCIPIPTGRLGLAVAFDISASIYDEVGSFRINDGRTSVSDNRWFEMIQLDSGPFGNERRLCECAMLIFPKGSE